MRSRRAVGILTNAVSNALSKDGSRSGQDQTSSPIIRVSVRPCARPPSAAITRSRPDGALTSSWRRTSAGKARTWVLRIAPAIRACSRDPAASATEACSTQSR
jgi:hypothetical protein